MPGPASRDVTGIVLHMQKGLGEDESNRTLKLMCRARKNWIPVTH